MEEQIIDFYSIHSLTYGFVSLLNQGLPVEDGLVGAEPKCYF